MMFAQRLSVTLTPHGRASTDLRPVETTWPRLVEALREHVIGPKDSEALIPAQFRECEHPCTNPGRKCKPGQLHRLARNVIAVTLLAYDLDENLDLLGYLDILRSRGVPFAAYSTHSYDGVAVKARLLIPLDRPIQISTPREWSHEHWPRMRDLWDVPSSADASCRDPSRLYHLPRVASADAPRFFYVG